MGWSAQQPSNRDEEHSNVDDALDLLKGLFGDKDGLSSEARRALEAKLHGLLSDAVSVALKELGAGANGSVDGSIALCRFLSGVAEKELPGVPLSPATANTAALGANHAHRSEEVVMNWTLWLRVSVDPSQMLHELQAVVDQPASAAHVRATLWSAASLAKNGRLPTIGAPALAALPPLILHTMVGPHSADEDVQFRAAQAISVLCGAGGAGVPADPTVVSQALESVLIRETQRDQRNFDVVEKLLKVSARFQRLHGHVCLLRSPAFTGDPSRLETLLSDIAYPKYLVYEPGEVVRCNAAAAVVPVLKAASGDLQELALLALRKLLESASELGADAEETLLEGVAGLVHVLGAAACATVPPTSVFFRDAFGALRVVAETRLPSVVEQLRTQQVVFAALQARLSLEDTNFAELTQACKLVIVLTSVKKLLEELAVEPFRPRVIRAACYSIAEGDYEDEELRPCAHLIVQTALNLIEQYGGPCGNKAEAWEFTAMAGALGVAGRYLDVLAENGGAELVRPTLIAMLQFVQRSSDPERGSHGLLHWATWALCEAASNSRTAHKWLKEHSDTMPVLEHTVMALLGCNSYDAFEVADSEARQALLYSFSALAVLQGADPVIHAMTQHPQSCAVQAAGSTALRTLVQTGRLQLPAESAVAALQRACASCAGKPEVETPASMALGLLMGAH